MTTRQLNDPMVIQKKIRDNTMDVQSFLSDLSNWSTEMKAKELAESSEDILPMENIPVRSDPKKVVVNGTKDVNNSAVEQKSKKKGPSDYSSWERFDADKACEEVETSKTQKVESEEDAIRRKAIEMKLKIRANEKKDLGNQCLKEKDYAKAIECYTEGIRCDKKNAVLYANRAQAHIFLKQYQQAIDDCTESIQNDPSYIKAYFRRAKARVELGKLIDAKIDLNTVLKAEPRNVEAKQLLTGINAKAMQSLFGTNNNQTNNIPVTKSASSCSPTPSTTPNYRTPFALKTVRDLSLMLDDEEEDLYGAKGDTLEQQTFPKKIVPISKPLERRSKRPLLPIHVKIVGGQEKKMRLDFNGNEGSPSVSNNSSDFSTPVTDPSSPPSLSTSSNNISGLAESLPNIFSQLKMTSIPPKPKTAAVFNSDWKKLKQYPDMSAEYLKQMKTDDYLIFQDSMEYSILSDILDLLVWEFLPRGWEIISHLQGLLKVRRFSTLLMFTTEKDRANIRKLISECPSDIQSDLQSKYQA